MIYARFVATDSRVYTGQLIDEHTAYPLDGDVFARPEVAAAPVSIARLLPPVAPVNVFAIGRNYAAHIAETAAKRPERPLVFLKPTSAVTAPDTPILLPASAPEQVDYEAELAVVIGRAARGVTPAEARSYIFGYTAANDVTARDCQQNEQQWTRAKGFDTFCPLGPVLVSADALDPSDCRVQSRLNGETMQDARTSALLYSVDELVSYLSHQFTLLPGTVILTGTPEGVGYVRQPPVYLRDGDRIEVEVEGIGTLVNTVVAPRK